MVTVLYQMKLVYNTCYLQSTVTSKFTEYLLLTIDCHQQIYRIFAIDSRLSPATPIIQTTGTTSLSTCGPAYCFRRTCGKSVLGTKVLRNAVPERTKNFGWPVVQQVRDLCVYFFIFVFPFTRDLLFILKKFLWACDTAFYVIILETNVRIMYYFTCSSLNSHLVLFSLRTASESDNHDATCELSPQP